MSHARVLSLRNHLFFCIDSYTDLLFECGWSRRPWELKILGWFLQLSTAQGSFKSSEHSIGIQETLPQVDIPLSSPEPILATLLCRPSYEPSCSLPPTPLLQDSDGATVHRYANPHAAAHMGVDSPGSQSSSVFNICYIDTLQPLSSQLKNMDTKQQLSFIFQRCFPV